MMKNTTIDDVQPKANILTVTIGGEHYDHMEYNLVAWSWHATTGKWKYGGISAIPIGLRIYDTDFLKHLIQNQDSVVKSLFSNVGYLVISDVPTWVYYDSTNTFFNHVYTTSGSWHHRFNLGE